MRAILQRVRTASVTVSGETVGAIGQGLLVLLGVEPTDTDDDIQWLIQKLTGLRIFDDENGDWNRSVIDSGGAVLVVSQFTLFASTKKGTKPSWHRAAKPDFAEPMCERFIARLREVMPSRVQSGRFGAMMEVSLVNDGPVTLIIDTKARE